MGRIDMRTTSTGGVRPPRTPTRGGTSSVLRTDVRNGARDRGCRIGAGENAPSDDGGAGRRDGCSASAVRGPVSSLSLSAGHRHGRGDGVRGVLPRLLEVVRWAQL